jgi:ribonuclease Y
MDNTLIAVIGAVVALLGGIFAGKVLFAKNTTKQVEDAQALADKAVATATKREENFRSRSKVFKAKK